MKKIIVRRTLQIICGFCIGFLTGISGEIFIGTIATIILTILWIIQ